MYHILGTQGVGMNWGWEQRWWKGWRGSGWELCKRALSLMSKCHGCPNSTKPRLQVQAVQVFLTSVVKGGEYNRVG